MVSFSRSNVEEHQTIEKQTKNYLKKGGFIKVYDNYGSLVFKQTLKKSNKLSK